MFSPVAAPMRSWATRSSSSGPSPWENGRTTTMTLTRFAAEIKRLGGALDLEGTEFNTNNGWGFGGGYGTEHAGRVKDVDFVLRKGRACFRHMDEEPFANVRLTQADRTKFTPEMFLKLVG